MYPIRNATSHTDSFATLLQLLLTFWEIPSKIENFPEQLVEKQTFKNTTYEINRLFPAFDL